MELKLKGKQKIIVGIGIVFLILGLVIGYFDNYESQIKEISMSKIKSNLEMGNSKNLQTLEKGKVTIRYINTKGEKIAPDNEYEGYLGEEYSFDRKDIDGYIAYGKDPINKTGNYTTENQTIIFSYQDSINTIDIDNVNKNVTVKILNDKKVTEYNVKILTKSIDGDSLTGAGYKVTKDNEVIRSGIGYGENFVVGTIGVGEEGTDTYEIKQTTIPSGYEALFGKTSINIIKTLNSQTGLYEAKVEYDTNLGTLKAYVTDNNEIIIEIQNKQKDYGNIIIKYVDDNGQEIADQELYEEEVGTAYSYPKTGKEIEGYTFKEVQGKIKGSYTKEDIIVKYVYSKKEGYGTVIRKYVDEDGNEIAESEKSKGKIGTEYSFNKKGKDIEGYVFSKVKGKITGEYTSEDIIITYTYEKAPEEIFDLELNKTIKEVIVKENDQESTKKVKEENKIFKVEVASKKVKNTTIQVKYEIEIKNVGNVAGYAKEITDIIPDDMEYIETDEANWKKYQNTLTTEEFADVLLNPGDSVTISVTFEWKLTENNVGTRVNNAEITLYYNDKGLEDNTPDNTSSSSLIVSIKTGALSYTLEILGIILICVGIAIIISEKRKKDSIK